MLDSIALESGRPRRGRGEESLAEQLRQTRALLERLVDSTPDAVVACDGRGRVLLFNAAAERLTGRSAREALASLDAQSLYPPAVVAGLLARLHAEGSGGRVSGAAGEVLTGQGERVPVSISAAVVGEEPGEGVWVAVLEDLRERLSIENRLTSAEQKLRESEKQVVVAELAGAAAHELNQPLTSVLGYAELLRRRTATSDPSFRPIDRIFHEAERMAEIVRKIGRITRYETTPYVGNVRIVDIDKATGRKAGDE